MKYLAQQGEAKYKEKLLVMYTMSPSTRFRPLGNELNSTPSRCNSALGKWYVMPICGVSGDEWERVLLGWETFVVA
jgi:hypothetical protein